MSKQRWFLPTNTENLELFLSMGIVTCRDGLGESYIEDVMVENPSGYIPFLAKDNLSGAIEKALVEDENLTRCVIELDLSQILKMVVYADVEYELEGINEAGYIKKNILDIAELGEYNKILIPSPLPLQCIKHVMLESVVVKNEASKYFNKKLGYFSDKYFKSEPKLFKDEKKIVDLLELGNDKESSGVLSIQKRVIDYSKICALGGLIGLTFYQSKNGLESVNYFRDACNLQVLSKHSHKEFELFVNYFFENTKNNDEYALLCSELLRILAGSNGTVGEVKCEILIYLDTVSGFTESIQKYAKKLASRLRDIEERSLDMSPEDVFTKLMGSYSSKSNNENKKISMILVMYFFRDKTETMLKFYHEYFKEIDYVLFAMFFGVGDKYIGLPSQIKKIKGLNYYVSNRMVEYCYQFCSEDVSSFKDVKPPKSIISELITEKSEGELDGFVKWLSDDFLLLERDKFQSWELSNKGFSCKSKTVIKFGEEPVLSTKILLEKIKDQIFDFCNDIKDKFSKEVFEALNLNDKEVLEWELTNKGFSCESNTKLTFKEKPKLTTIINLSEIEKQLVVSTIGNDKDLFDYNRVYQQYEKYVK